MPRSDRSLTAGDIAFYVLIALALVFILWFPDAHRAGGVR